MNQIIVNPIDRSHHDGEGGFREQICALYFTGVWSDVLGNAWAKFIKTLCHVCQPGAASLDPENPGADTFAAWDRMDKLIENENVRGFYHTHPGDANYFSSQDYRMQEGLARSNGSLPLWHVVQCVNSPLAQAVCLNMINNSVFIYRFDDFDHDPLDPIILLPLPPKLEPMGRMVGFDLTN